MKNTTTIFTNGKSLFTLENYSRTAGVSHILGITFYKEVSKNVARSMHEKGNLHYITGIGDRKELENTIINRKSHYKNFIVS